MSPEYQALEMQPMLKRLAHRFFQWFCHSDYYAEISGDLEEMYQRNLKKGRRWAQWNYLLQVFGLFRPSLMRSFPQFTFIQPAMFRHYFNISTRILLKHKFYSIINILSLAVGMGVCLLIFQYIQFELSFDQFHQKASNIYRLTQTAIRNGEVLAKGVDVTYELGPEVQKSIPEVEEIVRIREQNTGLIFINSENDTKFQENNLYYVDKNFLQMFNFPLELGDRKTALNDEHSIVLTSQMAAKYFGTDNPVGKVIRISGGSLSGEFEVKGVLKPIPKNTHLQFDFLLPMEFILSHWRVYREGDGWDWEDFVTYVKLNPSANLEAVNKKMDQVVITHLGENLKKISLVIKSGLQPLVDVHLKSDQLSGENADNNGDIQNVWLFSIIAIFILLIAWMNYINLSTARAMQRAKEVGVRKSMGAIKTQLISQFLIEAFQINVIAAVLGIIFAYFALPLLNQIIGKDIHLTLLQNFNFWLCFTTIIISGTLLSGAYPAFILSSFNPIRTLKSAGLMPRRNFTLRKSLIVFQFMVSVMLIAGTYLIYKQVNFMKSQDLGMDIEKILVVNGPRVILETIGDDRKTLNKTFKTEVLRHHAISAITGSGEVPGKGFQWGGNVRKLGEPEDAVHIGNGFFVDKDFIKTFDFDMLASRNMPDDFTNFSWLIINEEAARVLELGIPEEAINEQVIFFEDTIKIGGVIKNFHWNSLKDAYTPMILALDNETAAYYSIKINLSDIPETIAYIKSVYHDLYPDDPFHYFFLEDDFNRQYQSDLQFGNLFSVFSLLAVFIACLGLFALVSFSATLRIKEIGIRKVLGASMTHLMMLLSREYIILLLIALVLALPALVIGSKLWLENYAYKVGLGIDFFLIPGLILLVIAMITVSYRTYATARANPVESLKTE